LAAFRGVDVFRSTDHLKVIREVKAELKLRNATKSESSLNDLASKMPCNNRRTILRGKETGQWLSALPSTMYFLELGFDTALAMHLSHNVFLVAHGRKCSKNAEYASSFFLPSNISFIAKAGLVIFFFPKVDILPEVWNQS
jgi:hypothetical protein